MTQMVRKQIYLQKSQEEHLKKVAEAQGISEAEVIRRVLENEIRLNSVYYRPAYDHEAWSKIVAFWQELDERGPVEQRPRNWKREELYEERISRYGRHSG